MSTPTPHEAAEKAFRATGDWEMAVEAALVVARQRDPQEQPASEMAALTAERDGLRNSLHAIELGIVQPSPKTVAADALNGRYFDPGTDAGIWHFEPALEAVPEPSRCKWWSDPSDDFYGVCVKEAYHDREGDPEHENEHGIRWRGDRWEAGN